VTDRPFGWSDDRLGRGGRRSVDGILGLELGQPAGESHVKIVGGVKTLRLERPAAVPMRLTVAGGTDSMVLDGVRLERRGGPTTLESPGWAKDKARFDVSIVGGAKSIEVVARP